LTDAQSLRAFEDHDKAGWLKLMKDDLIAIGGNTAKLSPDSLFNIRFRPSDAVLFDDPLPVAISTDRISKLTRYKLVAADASEVASQWSVRTRQGSITEPGTQKYTRGGSTGGVVDPYHPVLQRELMGLLQKQYGKANVVREQGWVDLTVSDGKRRLFIEIKTDVVAKRAIREALGQILEYAYFRSKWPHPNVEMFIIAPGQASAEVSAYLGILRSKFGVPITYCQFIPGDELPAQLCK
jgi:hypothetical protein